MDMGNECCSVCGKPTVFFSPHKRCAAVHKPERHSAVPESSTNRQGRNVVQVGVHSDRDNDPLRSCRKLLDEQCRILIETIVSRVVSADGPLGDKEARLANVLLGLDRSANTYNERLDRHGGDQISDCIDAIGRIVQSADDHLDSHNGDPVGTAAAESGRDTTGCGSLPHPGITYH
jgi:hypothetical protein